MRPPDIPLPGIPPPTRLRLILRLITAPLIILIRIIGARVSRWSLVLITVTTAAITAAITVTDRPSLFASEPRAAASPAARFFYAPRYSKALCHDLPDGSARV